MSKFEELKRRNVIRVGLAYLVIAWLIAQVADLALESFNAPDWVIQVVLLLLGIGFVVALVFSWAYELTPDGLKKEKDVVRDESVTTLTAKRLDYITLTAAASVLGVFLYQQLVPSDAKPTQGALHKSIAVLPFVNMSSDPEQDYFSDGVTEEILNALAKIKQLKVVGRTSSFVFKGKHDDLRLIGDTLGVAHILEGSVRKSGNQVRITAQLIQANDGFHLWSETYNGTLENVFDLQEEIARKVSNELKLLMNLEDGTRLASKMTTNAAAYDLFLRGRDHVRKRYDDNIPLGIALLHQAVALDPQFAEAWAVLAEAEAVSNNYLPVDFAASFERARAHIATAKDIDPSLHLPFAVSGMIKGSTAEQEDREGAVDYYMRFHANLATRSDGSDGQFQCK